MPHGRGVQRTASQEVLLVSNLRLLPRSINAQGCMLALLQTPAGDEWERQLRADLERLSEVLGDRLRTLDPSNLQTWMLLWPGCGKESKVLLAMIVRRCARQKGRADVLAQRYVEEQLVQEQICMDCGQVFKNKAAYLAPRSQGPREKGNGADDISGPESRVSVLQDVLPH